MIFLLDENLGLLWLKNFLLILCDILRAAKATNICVIKVNTKLYN